MPLNLVGLAALVLGVHSVDPEAALRRSFDRKSSVNVDAVVEKPFRGGDTITIRMQYDGAGRRRTEVLSPMVVRGRIFVDDGATWTTYNPDTKVLRVHPVPPDDDIDARMRLVHDNYRLEIDQKTTVAGRAAIRVVATPRNHDLRTQRFYLDAATFTPLKTETIDAMGSVSVQFTVRRIGFPGRMAKGTFDAPDAPGARHEDGHAPTPLSGDAFRQLGFRPALPRRSIPLGFRQQGVDLMDRGGRTPIAVRLSDGLVRVLVFQSKVEEASSDTRHDDSPKVSQDVGNVHIEVRGDDVPVAVRERILAAYVGFLQRGPRH